MIRLEDLPIAHPGRSLFTGVTPVLASQVDQRFSYRLFVPRDYRDDEPALDVWVFVHGTERRTEHFLDGAAELATARRAIVLTPLFPAAIGDPDDVHNYKMIEQDGVRYDLLLLSMLQEVASRWNVDVDRFVLHGFSGGGQFAHRFLYLHPERLQAVSIGAPGRITLPDAGSTWWHGVGDLQGRFGRGLDTSAISRVPIQIVIGALDNDPAEVAPSPGGADRLARAKSLRDGLRSLGATVQFDVVDAVGHVGAQAMPTVMRFIAEQT